VVSKQKMKKTRVKPENIWDFPGIIGYYPQREGAVMPPRRSGKKK